MATFRMPTRVELTGSNQDKIKTLNEVALEFNLQFRIDERDGAYIDNHPIRIPSITLPTFDDVVKHVRAVIKAMAQPVAIINTQADGLTKYILTFTKGNVANVMFAVGKNDEVSVGTQLYLNTQDQLGKLVADGARVFNQAQVDKLDEVGQHNLIDNCYSIPLDEVGVDLQHVGFAEVELADFVKATAKINKAKRRGDHKTAKRVADNYCKKQ